MDEYNAEEIASQIGEIRRKSGKRMILDATVIKELKSYDSFTLTRDNIFSLIKKELPETTEAEFNESIERLIKSKTIIAKEFTLFRLT